MSSEHTIDPEANYAISAAARLLRVSPSTLRDLERRGELECTRTPGGQRRFAGSELLRLSLLSRSVTPNKPAPRIALSVEEAQARQVWLGQVIARAQRELPTDTPADIRLRLAADLERALERWGPPSLASDVDPLVKSLVHRARLQTETAEDEAERHQMKGELVEFALTHLRRSIDRLPKRVVGTAGSLERRHVQATRSEIKFEICSRSVFEAMRPGIRPGNSPMSSLQPGMWNKLLPRACRTPPSSPPWVRRGWLGAWRQRPPSTRGSGRRRPSSRLRSCPSLTSS